jgi:hypothetical protein
LAQRPGGYSMRSLRLGRSVPRRSSDSAPQFYSGGCGFDFRRVPGTPPVALSLNLGATRRSPGEEPYLSSQFLSDRFLGSVGLFGLPANLPTN